MGRCNSRDWCKKEGWRKEGSRLYRHNLLIIVGAICDARFRVMVIRTEFSWLILAIPAIGVPRLDPVWLDRFRCYIAFISNLIQLGLSKQ